MDQIAEYFPEHLIAILEHHVHVPGADPLTTPAGEARYQYYGGGGTPTVWVDGSEEVGGGGPSMLKKFAFQRYEKALLRSWENPPLVDLSLSARRDGNRVRVSVQAARAEADSAVEGVVRIALVERSVEYEGGNTIRHHAYVVRHLSDPEAEVTVLKEGRATVEDEIDLDQVERDQLAYLENFESDPPERFEGFGGFRDKPVTLDPADLLVVAWVEDRQTRKIHQAAKAGL
jgi:hypothetical protein